MIGSAAGVDAPRGVHCICCFFAMRLRITWFTVRFNEGWADRPRGASRATARGGGSAVVVWRSAQFSKANSCQREESRGRPSSLSTHSFPATCVQYSQILAHREDCKKVPMRNRTVATTRTFDTIRPCASQCWVIDVPKVCERSRGCSCASRWAIGPKGIKWLGRFPKES
jgi:hypothetical protein